MTGRGGFITIEGVEGVGKSTNVACVVEMLQAAGRTVLSTREPGGTPVGEEIRRLLLAPTTALSPLGEVLLMFAARAAHLDAVVRPALAAGTWVVCDRFTDASFAYQGGGRGLPEAAIARLVELVHPDLEPDLTLLLDAPPGVTSGRQASRTAVDRFEQEGADFFARVREAYARRAALEPRRIRTIDAARPLVAVQADIRSELGRFLRESTFEHAGK
jgi:dTMP kinase